MLNTDRSSPETRALRAQHFGHVQTPHEIEYSTQAARNPKYFTRGLPRASRHPRRGRNKVAHLEALASDSSPVDSRASEPSGSSAPPFSLTLALFVLSGATGLVDQLCFSKYLSYIVGSTAYAVSAVLAAFMTGLAIGAHLGGKASASCHAATARPTAGSSSSWRERSPQRRSRSARSRLYHASLARSMPDSLYLLSVVRWLVALGVVVIPTMAMGATLPLLVAHLRHG